jgi:hypothetical protein
LWSIVTVKQFGNPLKKECHPDVPLKYFLGPDQLHVASNSLGPETVSREVRLAKTNLDRGIQIHAGKETV